MGQKVNPNGFRVGVNRTWDSRWYAGREYASLLHQDIAIRQFIRKKMSQAGISKIVIERMAKKASVTIHSARPGIIIGKRGADIETLKGELSKMMGSDVQLNIIEIRKPEIDSRLVAESIAQQMEKRVSYKRAMKRAIQSALRQGAKGIRVRCNGRLGGVEIARKEEYIEGRVPLHTLRGDIDYGTATAFTTYGTCGIKVWIFKGEVMDTDSKVSTQGSEEKQASPAG